MSEARQLLTRILSRPAGLVGFAIVVLTLLVALAAPRLTGTAALKN